MRVTMAFGMPHDSDYEALDWVCAIGMAHAGMMLPDIYIHAHQVLTTPLAVPLALKLGYSTHIAHIIESGCAVHDIGKIAVIPELFLNRNVLLSRDSETFRRIQRHTEYGAVFFQTMIERVGHEHVFRPIADICRYHHERFDGTGYYGLAGHAIPMHARIAGVLDALSAMTEPLRMYRVPLSLDAAVAELQACAGTQFDPVVVEALLEVLETYDWPGAAAAH